MTRYPKATFAKPSVGVVQITETNITIWVMTARYKTNSDSALRRPAVLAVIGVGATLVLALIVVIALLKSGDATTVSKNAALIGALVALGGVFTTQMVNSALEERRAQTARDIEAGRAEEARSTEAQRAQEAALQKYLEEMGKFLADSERPLLKAAPGDDLSTLARAQTLAALESLGPRQKRVLMQFLSESGLISRNDPVVKLRWANLRGTDLRGIDLRLTDLSSVDLSEAKVAGASLVQTDLRGAILRRVDLRGAFLTSTGLQQADLQQADLTGAHITDEQVRELEKVREGEHLKGTTMPNGTKHD